jgi:hypothetical protein
LHKLRPEISPTSHSRAKWLLSSAVGLSVWGLRSPESDQRWGWRESKPSKILAEWGLCRGLGQYHWIRRYRAVSSL